MDLPKVTQWGVAELGNEPQQCDSRALTLNYNTTLSQADGARPRHKLEEKTESQVPEGPNINLKIRTRMINKRRS